MSCPIRTQINDWKEKQTPRKLPKLPNDIIINIVKLAMDSKLKDIQKLEKQTKKYHEHRLWYDDEWEGEEENWNVETGKMSLTYWKPDEKFGGEDIVDCNDINTNHSEVMAELKFRVELFQDNVDEDPGVYGLDVNDIEDWSFPIKHFIDEINNPDLKDWEDIMMSY
jgi:hypothetical protein